MSGLYRTFKTNYVPYFADGRGRDRYIAYNNAGFFHDFPKYLNPTNTYRTGTFFGTKIVKHIKSPSIKTPNFHYHSDGNGRDKYILVNGGGLFYDSKPLISYKLTDFLRKNDYKYHSPSNRRIALSRDEKKYNKLLRSIEKEVIDRLYNKEKKKFMKKPKFDPKNLFSSEEIPNDFNDNIYKNKTTNYFLTTNNNNLKNNYNFNECLTQNLKDENNKNEYYNIKTLNNENTKLNKLRYKPKLVIDASNNNKLNVSSKDNINPSCKTSNDFYNDIEKIKKYETIKDKNSIKFKKPPYFHILNEHSLEKENEY